MKQVFKAIQYWRNRFSKCPKQMYILQISMMAVITYFTIYLLYSFSQYPQIVLDQAKLYGEQLQNLKDFEIEGNGIRSTSSDPWIEYHSEIPVKIKVIELDISGVEDENLDGEIFDTDTWNSSVYQVENGKILVFFYDSENPVKKNLRFDLVASNSTYLEIEQIIINSRYGLCHNIIKYMLLTLLYIFTYEISIFLMYDLMKNNQEIYNQKKIPLLICITAPCILMMVILFCPVRDSLLLWMYLLTILFILSLILIIKRFENNSQILEFSIIFLSAFLSVGIAELLSGVEYNFKNPAALLLNILLAALPMLVLYCVLRNLKPAVVIGHLLVVIIAIINHYFYQFRGNPLELSDFLLAGTALTVINNYVFEIDPELFFCLLFELCVAGCLLSAEKKPVRRSYFFISLILSCIIMLTGAIYTPAVSYWNIAANTQRYGYVSSFVAYAKHDLIHRKPAGYTKEAVLNVLEKYEEVQVNQTIAEYPNIIVIMNEAFADLPETYGFTTDKDGMPFIHSLKENTVKGNILASVFGGSTANTEYEFLTGNTMAFLSEGNVPYMQFVKSDQESLVHELKALGYQTIAFHPYTARNYNRDKVYSFLGFEKFITDADELLYTEKLRAYMSDQADFQNLIHIYENRDKTRPFYLFNVTMQNHGGYSLYKSEVDITVKPESEELQSAQLLEYLSLIRSTDAAFQTLVEYFEKENARTVILMFGDHQPGLDADIYDTMIQVGEAILAETSEISYMIPFVLWANYDLEPEDNILTSPNYLRTILFEKAGIPSGSYDRFLSACRKEYPAINHMGYYDISGNFYSAEDSLETYGMLMEYQILQYANMFDRTVWK